MTENKNALRKFIYWCLTGLFLMFYGITHSLALTYTNIGELRDITQQLVSTDYGDAPFTNPINSGYAFGQVLQVDYIISNYRFNANTNYQLESHLTSQVFTNANYYSVQGLNGESCIISYSNSILNDDNYPRWAFQCPHDTDEITITIKNSSNDYLWSGTGIFNWTTALLKSSDTSLSSGSSETDSVINNQNQNTQNIINNQNQNNQQLQETIKDQFQGCRQSYNLYDKKNRLNGWINNTGAISQSGNYYYTSNYIRIENNTNYSINNIGGTNPSYCLYDSQYNIIECQKYNGSTSISFNSKNSNYIRFSIPQDKINIVMFSKSDTPLDYEPYGEEICTNRLDEAEKTRKGILATLKDIPNQIGEMIKNLFIPSEEELENIINDFKEWAERKFGILYEAINVVIQFVNSFINLTEDNDVIIHIPNITVPNFEENIIVNEQDWNWSELLRSKESIRNLWEIYLSFVDVFIILAFLNLCENIFAGITGEPVGQEDQIYESTGESWDVNDNTGEVTNHKVWKKESRRK